MTDSLAISLSPFARFQQDAAEEFSFAMRDLRIPVHSPDEGLLTAMRKIAGDGAPEGELMRPLAFNDAFQLHFYVQELIEQGWLSHAVWREGARFATCVPIQRDHRLTETPVIEGRWMLSRFALLRRSGNRVLLESPLARAHIELHHPLAAALVAALASPCDAAGLAAAVPAIGVPTAALFLELLIRAGFATAADSAGNPGEDAGSALAQWEFHDLFFHTRSREGRHANPYGGVNRFPSTAPAVKPPMTGDFIDLYQPDMEYLREHDVPFTRVLEDRRSRREHASPPISACQLGEFLYRAARVTRMVDASGGPHAWRPYPGGGACYELEIYPVIRECQGIEPGIYQYCPLEHRLCRIAPRTEDTDWLLENTAFTIHGSPPQVLFEISARFGRVNWRYGSMAYATILKNTGVLMQTMYLVAEAMGLAACAAGGGHSDMFTRAAGTNYYEETSVGEFILGSRPG